MIFEKAERNESTTIKKFYWNFIDEMSDVNDQIGWKKGIGKRVVKEILNYAKTEGKKAVRLDILGTNTTAEKLYTGWGFQFVQAKIMFYEDTGWTEYKMYEVKA